MIQRLNSTPENNTPELKEGQEQVIRPLFRQTQQQQKPKEVDIKEYINTQCNNVVAFVINWIKSTFTSDLMNYLKNEYKQELIKELEHATNRKTNR